MSGGGNSDDPYGKCKYPIEEEQKGGEGGGRGGGGGVGGEGVGGEVVG